MIVIEEIDYLEHYGVLRRSGRYPYGSGGDGTPIESPRSFLETVAKLRGDGLSEKDIAQGLGFSSVTQLRDTKTIARHEDRASRIAFAQRLKDKGTSNVEIGSRLGIPESSVRSLLAAGEKDSSNQLQSISNMLKGQVDQHEYIDIGKGVENQLGVSKGKLRSAVAILENQGYAVHTVQVDQIGTDTKTLVKVLAPPGTQYRDIVQAKEKIRLPNETSTDNGRSFLGLQKPLSIDLDRVDVRYAKDGGGDADGVVYVRPGVSDVSLGGGRYAQVRIAVNGTHYIKGMAVYKDDLPKGVDLQFNTNKTDTGNKLDALKPMKDDPDNPFGSFINRQILARDENGKEHTTSAMNIVNDEESWEKWSKTLSTQVLSKQKPILAKTQLDLAYNSKKDELDEIMSLTNPVVKQKLLQSYSDSVDKAAVNLKATALPRQNTHVILPVKSLKETEVYARNYENGERVVLIRHPHGGTFEIPELVVNNNNREAKGMLGTATTAIGIHPNVAKKLSGADFDGDTVLVIPNNNGKIRTSATLQGLKDFDPQKAYPGYPGMPEMSDQTKGAQMGLVSNLITDMTIKGANHDQMARAIRHSMVVIDAQKHGLNYKESAKANGIPQLMKEYQEGRAQGGASTLISRAKSRTEVAQRTLRRASEGGPIDRKTGEKVYVPTGESFVNEKGKVIFRTQTSRKLAETKDAHTLSAGTQIEGIYADHSNRLKALANQARKELVNTEIKKVVPTTSTAYTNEVTSLNSKLNRALKNAPLERRAQLIANTTVSLKRQAKPNMEKAELKKIKSAAIIEARTRMQASKERIEFTQDEWNAVQAGAISNHKLNELLNHADLDSVKKLATPRTTILMTSTKVAAAKAMAANGYSQAEIASHLGVSLTTLKTSLT